MAMKWLIGRAASDDYSTFYQQHAMKTQNIMTGSRSEKRVKWVLFELLATGAHFTCRLHYVPRYMTTLRALLYIVVVMYVQINFTHDCLCLNWGVVIGERLELTTGACGSGVIEHDCKYSGDEITILTQWGRDKMAAIFPTTLSNTFSWMKIL